MDESSESICDSFDSDDSIYEKWNPPPIQIDESQVVTIGFKIKSDVNAASDSKEEEKWSTKPKKNKNARKYSNIDETGCKDELKFQSRNIIEDNVRGESSKSVPLYNCTEFVATTQLTIDNSDNICDITKISIENKVNTNNNCISDNSKLECTTMQDKHLDEMKEIYCVDEQMLSTVFYYVSKCKLGYENMPEKDHIELYQKNIKKKTKQKSSKKKKKSRMLAVLNENLAIMTDKADLINGNMTNNLEVNLDEVYCTNKYSPNDYIKLIQYDVVCTNDNGVQIIKKKYIYEDNLVIRLEFDNLSENDYFTCIINVLDNNSVLKDREMKVKKLHLNTLESYIAATYNRSINTSEVNYTNEKDSEHKNSVQYIEYGINNRNVSQNDFKELSNHENDVKNIDANIFTIEPVININVEKVKKKKKKKSNSKKVKKNICLTDDENKNNSKSNIENVEIIKKKKKKKSNSKKVKENICLTDDENKNESKSNICDRKQSDMTDCEYLKHIIETKAPKTLTSDTLKLDDYSEISKTDDVFHNLKISDTEVNFSQVEEGGTITESSTKLGNLSIYFKSLYKIIECVIHIWKGMKIDTKDDCDISVLNEINNIIDHNSLQSNCITDKIDSHKMQQEDIVILPNKNSTFRNKLLRLILFINIEDIYFIKDCFDSGINLSESRKFLCLDGTYPTQLILSSEIQNRLLDYLTMDENHLKNYLKKYCEVVTKMEGLNIGVEDMIDLITQSYRTFLFLEKQKLLTRMCFFETVICNILPGYFRRDSPVPYAFDGTGKIVLVAGNVVLQEMIEDIFVKNRKAKSVTGVDLLENSKLCSTEDSKDNSNCNNFVIKSLSETVQPKENSQVLTENKQKLENGQTNKIKNTEKGIQNNNSFRNNLNCEENVKSELFKQAFSKFFQHITLCHLNFIMQCIEYGIDLSESYKFIKIEKNISLDNCIPKQLIFEMLFEYLLSNVVNRYDFFIQIYKTIFNIDLPGKNLNKIMHQIEENYTNFLNSEFERLVVNGLPFSKSLVCNIVPGYFNRNSFIPYAFDLKGRMLLIIGNEKLKNKLEKKIQKLHKASTDFANIELKTDLQKRIKSFLECIMYAQETLIRTSESITNAQYICNPIVCIHALKNMSAWNDYKEKRLYELIHDLSTNGNALHKYVKYYYVQTKGERTNNTSVIEMMDFVEKCYNGYITALVIYGPSQSMPLEIISSLKWSPFNRILNKSDFI